MRRSCLAVVVTTALACGPSGSPDPYQEALQGSWSSCVSDGAADTFERLTFTGDAIEWTLSTHATSDGTCGGAGTVVRHVSGSFTVGEFVNATLDGTSVAARGLDVTEPARMFYTTIYVDEASTPRVLHVGEADLVTGRDMTSGAKRPIVLGGNPLVER